METICVTCMEKGIYVLLRFIGKMLANEYFHGNSSDENVFGPTSQKHNFSNIHLLKPSTGKRDFPQFPPFPVPCMQVLMRASANAYKCY